ncbi:hypothetical protein [Mycolicibacterium litorale]|uniref:Uncharacterized protein n=1 Tax=Mycolicibacterium litorale TaxID=758802 RepID=A0AAD1IQB6_9MYCO|nr:hypothetical protein [Mycolicibacterium litorale]MCV7416447.1 hypothetical protein [Mycolicibacterium litorale]TDY09701.1 hypothetical protein BCL50_1798 [Mycolicibacterium litorale]BBY17647.1 hypothetical protein MLIT_32390 [Mycolicibacterium litorale]
MDWIEDRWRDLTALGSAGWLAVAAWAALLLGVVALIVVTRALRRTRDLRADELKPHVVMFMEPHPSDWHVIELVVRNFGQSAAHDIRFDFTHPPTVARYEERVDGHPDIVELELPNELPVLAPGQEWRTVWDSAVDRNELAGSIRSRFDGLVTFYDRPRASRRPKEYTNRVVLDWATLQPVQRLELMSSHDLARQEKQKLELLRTVLTYFQYASKETRPEVLRAEIQRMSNAVKETQDRWRTRQHDETTVLDFPWIERNGAPVYSGVTREAGRHHRGA